MPANLDPQLALDERQINDPALERALERYLRASDDVREANQVKKTYRMEVDAALAKHPIEVDQALRVGRFRIEKRLSEARHVEFDTEPKEQLRIGLVDEDGAPAKRPAAVKEPSVSDDEDLRPRGEVNADALRGEAARSVVDEPTPISRRGRNGAQQPPISH